MTAVTLGVDFGTSNSAAAVIENGKPRRLAIEHGAETLPTAVFFPADGGKMLIGEAAGEALIEGEEGRYMRALKSVLGTALFHEERRLGNRRQTLAQVVTAFLVRLRERAEAELGQKIDGVLSGRPVHFHSSDPARDAAAEADLRACYEAAGFTRIDFLNEPEAAARASGAAALDGRPGLVVDIGGGTSDFTVFRGGNAGIEVLASHGIRLGGTDFDQAISLAHAMPHLGHGGQLRRTFGEGLLPMPTAIYTELATWAKIPFLYTPETRRSVTNLLREAVEPEKLERLSEVLEHELGHELAFAVEKGKIAANGNNGAPAMIRMTMIERGLGAEISAGSMAQALSDQALRLAEAARETLTMAGCEAQDIGTVVLVGGSSLMGMVVEMAQTLCPGARIERAEAFTAIVDGLALSLADRALQEAQAGA